MVRCQEPGPVTNDAPNGARPALDHRYAVFGWWRIVAAAPALEPSLAGSRTQISARGRSFQAEYDSRAACLARRVGTVQNAVVCRNHASGVSEFRGTG